jgi:hypothetical protein
MTLWALLCAPSFGREVNVLHAKGHLRDGFVALIEGDENADDGLFFYDSYKQERLWWLSGQLWACTDTLPVLYCDELRLPQGSTYAQAARLIRQPAAV